VDTDTALDRALKTSSLTFFGKPFHAVMDISAETKGYSGQIEVWWVNDTKYRLVVKSAHFSQEKVVNGSRVFEKDDGDYYPRWLENFVLALLDPVPIAKNLRGLGGTLTFGQKGLATEPCIVRDDRPGGITDQMTWGRLCFFTFSPLIDFVQATNIFLEFTDYRDFGKKQVARSYKTAVGNSEYATGVLTTLEPFERPDDAMFTVATDTPAEQRIATEFVSTLKEESMVESAPMIAWPPVREGKTDGYMIVYARTDRTGQVRETRHFNSDNAGLEDFGTEQALKYKFKPLVVSDVARQMETPLVLHFSSRVDNPIPILTVEQMKHQMSGCSIPKLPSGSSSITIRVSVNQDGKMAGMQPVGKGVGSAWLAAMNTLRPCHYAPYLVDGKPTYYKGDVELKAP
jgi:hypothetical protein